jgi:RNA 2',3'-cyclic 3'-phosphodiesterase
VLDALGAAATGLEVPGARWLPAENLHVTVQFLGEVADEDLEPLLAASAAACATRPRFALRIERLAPGPPGSRPRMIWAHGVPSEDFSALCGAVADAAAPFAPRMRPPRRALPHVTMARFARPPRRDALAHATVDLDSDIAVERCGLVRSRLSPAGAIYSPLAPLPLAAA